MASTPVMRIELAQTEAGANLRAEVLRLKGFEVTGPESVKTVWVSKAKADGSADTVLTYIDDDFGDGEDVVWVVTGRKKG